MAKTLYSTARQIREGAARRLDYATRDLRSEQTRFLAYAAVSDGGAWQVARARASADRETAAAKERDAAEEAYQQAVVGVCCAVIGDGGYDTYIRQGIPPASGGRYTTPILAACTERAVALGLDWIGLHAAYLAQAPARVAAADRASQYRRALSGQCGREAQREAQRTDPTWIASGHRVPESGELFATKSDQK